LVVAARHPGVAVRQVAILGQSLVGSVEEAMRLGQLQFQL